MVLLSQLNRKASYCGLSTFAGAVYTSIFMEINYNSKETYFASILISTLGSGISGEMHRHPVTQLW